MILPLPIKQGGEPDFDFINLKEYPSIFDDLILGFPAPQSLFESLGAYDSLSSIPMGTLVIYDVGDFEASFVPTLKDFSRLDKRFQIAPGTWAKLPQYQNYGFAVFKLKVGAHKVHPMAFAFARADATRLFFPTVHIHDGKVHLKAEFDHVLYAQPRPPEFLKFIDWRESATPAKNFVKIEKTRGIVSGEDHCYQKTLVGNLPNRDVWLSKL